MSETTTPSSTPQVPSQQTVTSQVTRSVTTDTTSPIPITTFVSWAQHAIFALFGIGFVAWAVLVWQARDDVKTIYYRLEQMQRDYAHIDGDLIEHRNLNAHNGAAIQNAETRRDVQQLERRINELEGRMQGLTDREYGAHDDYGNPRANGRAR